MSQVDPAAFADIALEMHSEPDVDRMIQRLVGYAREATSCDDAGLLLRNGRRGVETVGATDVRVERSDLLQKEIGEGPALRAMRDQHAVVADTRADDRWPRWASGAARLGLRSVLSVSLPTSSGTLGSLNMYARRPRDFDRDEVADLQTFAKHASLALAEAREERGLREAIEARHRIGQAQGILMERFGIDAERAFAILRRYSRDTNIKLRMVAEQVIETRRMPG